MELRKESTEKGVLITGSSGFIGFHTAKSYLEDGVPVVGIDDENGYYDPRLKRARREILESYPNFQFHLGGVEDHAVLEKAFASEGFDTVIHLAAQAGVRHSLKYPESYVRSNLTGFVNLMEAARANPQCARSLVFASSSSVYGKNEKQPFSAQDRTDAPISLYAATKKANEAIAHAYAHLTGIPMVGLRFFTVYGPFGRPDMAYFSFAEKILAGKEIEVFNGGKMRRDFTYVDDIVQGIKAAARVRSGFEVYNLGNDQPEDLETMISTLEDALGKKAAKKYLPMQAGDVESTWADIEKTKKDLGWSPKTKLSEGLGKFAEWFLKWKQTH